MAKRSIKEMKEELQKLPSVTPWEDIKENEIYHIPPLITLERRDLHILSKNGNSAVYVRVGDKEKKERTLYDSSVFARFLVKRKKY